MRVVPAPPEVDRITDQMSENLHRAVMQEREVRDGIEQLALCGVSAAQIAKRAALKRATVDAALTVVGSEATKARMDNDGLTLDQAAIFAEFEGDNQATEKLTRALSWNRPRPQRPEPSNIHAEALRNTRSHDPAREGPRR